MHRLGTRILTVGVAALFCTFACSEGTGDGDGGTGGTGGEMDGAGGDTGGTGGDATGGTGGTESNAGGTGGNGNEEPSVSYRFDSDLEGFVVDWEGPESWSPGATGMGGMAGASFLSSVEWTGEDGEPEDGSVEATIPFDFVGTGSTDDLQKAHFALPFNEPMDLTNTVVSVNIKLVSGGPTDESCPMNGKVFVKTTEEWIWGDGGTVDLEEGLWIDATMESSAPNYEDEGYDESDAYSIGIEITPNSSEGCEAGEAIVRFDTFSY